MALLSELSAYDRVLRSCLTQSTSLATTIFRQLTRSATTSHITVPKNVVTWHTAIRSAFRDDEERCKQATEGRVYIFRDEKPLHENAGQIGVSFEQLGTVPILRLSTDVQTFLFAAAIALV